MKNFHALLDYSLHGLLLFFILGSVGVVLGLVRPKKLLSWVIGLAVLIPLAFHVGMPMMKQFSARYGNLPVFIGCVLLIMAIMARFEFTRHVLAGIFANFIYDNIRIILVVTGVMGALAVVMAALGKWSMELELDNREMRKVGFACVVGSGNGKDYSN